MDMDSITLWTPRMKKTTECLFLIFANANSFLIFAHENVNSKKHVNICICECEYSNVQFLTGIQCSFPVHVPGCSYNN